MNTGSNDSNQTERWLMMTKMPIYLLIFSIIFTGFHISLEGQTAITTTKFDTTQLIQNRGYFSKTVENQWAHTEMAAAINPLNSQNIVVGFNSSYPQSYPTILTQGVKYTFDGGLTWQVIDSLPQANELGMASDPGCDFDLSGNVYVSYISYGGGQNDEVRYSRSTDGGVTWDTPVTVFTSSGNFGVDRPNIVIDANPYSRFEGRKYFAWSKSSGRLLTNGMQLVASHKLDSVRTISSDKGWGVDMAVSSTGNLYVVWCDFHGNVRMVKSTNGGETFTSTQTIVSGVQNPVNLGELGARYYPSIAIDKSTFHPGRIYVSYHSGSSTDVDVFLIHSDDRGDSWSSPIMVNNDKQPGESNGKSQWFPWIAINQHGLIQLNFYDNRNGGSSNEAQSYTAISYDGGATFVNDSASTRFSLTPILGLRDGYYTDYLATIAGGDFTVPFWTAPVSGAYDVLGTVQSRRTLVSFANRYGNQEAGGSLTLANENSHNSPFSELLPLNAYETVETDQQRFLNWYSTGTDLQHHDWNNEDQEFLLLKKFRTRPNLSQFAKYSEIKSVSISSTEGPIIKIQDPWLSQNTTDYTEIQGSHQVFLNQNSDFQPDKPIYRLRARCVAPNP